MPLKYLRNTGLLNRVVAFPGRGGAGTPWIRFHEYFAAFPPLRQPAPKPGQQPRVNGSTMCHNTIQTAMREAATPDLAFAVHGGSYNSLASLNLTFAIFMLGTRVPSLSWQMPAHFNTSDFVAVVPSLSWQI